MANAVQPIRQRAPAPMRAHSAGDTSTLGAQLELSPPALVRLLSVTGTKSDFVLSASDGSLSVKVRLTVSSVPASQVTIGTRGAWLDWQRSTLTYRCNRVALSRMELRLLVALLEHSPQPASRAELVSALWETDASTAVERERALSVWICMLRRRLTEIGLPGAITTIRKGGYSLSL